MDWKVIKTAVEHRRAVKRATKIFHAKSGTPEDDELGVLLLLIKDYEDRTVKMPEIGVLEVIKEKMAQRLKDYFHLPAETFLHFLYKK